MRICMVAEGCYPYVVGGVSGWIHSMIKSFPEVEFVILAIVANRQTSGKFVYELPENVTEVHEVYLDDYDWNSSKNKSRSSHLNKRYFHALRSLVFNQDPEWDVIFDLFQKENFSVNDLLMGPSFLAVAMELYRLRYSQIVFSDFLWTLRSIYLPLFLILKSRVPKADLYHCVATGYAGVLGAMARHIYGCGLMVSEHGIYTREREEELLRATWVAGKYKNIWIEQFYKMSALAYGRAKIVTCLYSHAKELQTELGCQPEKIRITPNGIDTERLANLAQKEEDGMVHVGAVLRVTPIKDVKTLIQAFAFAKQKVPNLKLWIMGPTEEEPEYARECFELVEALKVTDIVFTGRVDIRDYLGKMDLMILTSISEGQPLSILEGYAAHKPVIATDVGDCRWLIYGSDDGIGPAGILTHIMNIEEIAHAIINLARDEKLRCEMGENGYKRVMKQFKIEDMKSTYRQLYKAFADEAGLAWNGE